MRVLKKILFGSLVLFVLAGAEFVYMNWFWSVSVIVKNVGAVPLRDVRVEVTGREYALGEIPPGESKRTDVEPTAESAVTAVYAGPSAAPVRAEADVYIGPGSLYHGTVRFELDPAKRDVPPIPNSLRIFP